MAGKEVSDCSPAKLSQLARGLMIIADDADELALLEERYKTSRANLGNFALTIVTSLGCNFDCPYCFEAKHPSIMDAHVQEQVLRIVDDQLPKISTLNVTWYGGEPLVGKQPLLALSDAFVGRCKRAGVVYDADIVTNGYLLDEDTCVELKEHHVSRVQVTLDGPPETHDVMRPLAGGRGSFWPIVDNLPHAIRYLAVTVRVNVDRTNFSGVEELLQILADRGLAGRLNVYPGQIVAVSDAVQAPSARYSAPCFSNADFARAELEFRQLVHRYGFSQYSLPRPTGAPCTAVRANELVVGSKGELYKCWDSVGNPLEVIGHVRDYDNPNARIMKWLKYDPFSNEECRSCIALPVCMGGCAHHAMSPGQYENRCGTFRHTHRDQVLQFVMDAEKRGTEGLIRPQLVARRMETR